VSQIRDFLRELMRRRVWRAAAVYAVVGWLVIQIAVTTFPLLFFPEWLARAVVVLVLLGFPVVLVLAWAFELTPEGLQRAGAGWGEGDRVVSEEPLGSERSGLPAWGPQSRRAVLTLFVAGLVVAAAGYFAVARLLGFPEGRAEVGAVAPVPSAHLQLILPPGVTLPLDSDYPLLAFSPDGSRLVFVGERDGRRELYSRLLTDSVSRPIPGTENSYDPFFSPDGKWIAFFSGSLLLKIATSGGSPIPIHRVAGEGVARGAAWVSDTTLVFGGSPNSGLLIDVISEGQVRRNVDWDSLTSASIPAAWPTQVSGRREVIFTRNPDDKVDDTDIALFLIESGEAKTLLNGAISPRYSPTGHLLFARDSTLHAIAYDPSERKTTGPEQEIVRGVAVGGFGVSHYAVGGGNLAYVAGGMIATDFELVWVDRTGKVVGTLHQGPRYKDPRISPDGGRVAVTVLEGPNSDVWVLDTTRNTLQPLTRHPGEDFDPVWSPDGSSLAIASEIGEDRGEAGPALAWIPAPGGATEQLVSTPELGAWEFPTSWTPDGRSILVTTRREGRSADIALFPLDGDGKLVPLLDTPADEVGGRISPDGRWLTYVSDRSGRDEIWIRPFPGSGTSIQVSADGALEPVWSWDSREIFYRSGLEMLVVSVSPGREPVLSPPRQLFTGRFERNLFGGESANFDVSPKGDRFLMVRRKETVQPTVIHIVLNWPSVFLPAGDGGR